MNEPNDLVRDDLRDRLLDQALRETLGAESPPDLSERILAAADETHPKHPEGKGEKVMDRPKRRRLVWAVAAAAASLLIVGGALWAHGKWSRGREIARLEKEMEEYNRIHGVPPDASSSLNHQFSADLDIPFESSLGEVPGEALIFDSALAGASSQTSTPYTIAKPFWELDPLPSVSDPCLAVSQGPLPEGSVLPYLSQMPDGLKSKSSADGETRSFYFRSTRPGETAAGSGYVVQKNQSSTLVLAGNSKDAERVVWSPDAHDIGGQTLPAPYYMKDDVQYFPPGASLQQLCEETNRLVEEMREVGTQRDAAISEAISQTDAANTLAVEKQDLEKQAALASERLVGNLKVLRWFSVESGQGPGRGGDQYVRLVENPFLAAKLHRWSTFSIDVDTASYANVRRFLLKEGQLPPPDAVRIEELVNYFDYDYSPPEGDVPFASHIEVAGCPWAPDRRLVRIALKGREIETNQRPASNLVFLLDVSGSMNQPDKLPLLQAGMKLLAGQLRENDHVAIVVYAGSEGLVLPSTPGGRRAKILDAIDRLSAGGSTNGGAGISLAYKIAQEQFLEGGVNRVILCTDGDFNVGTTSTGDLERMVEEKATSGVFLSVLGFGRGNLNDAMMETISNKGNGNYAYIDSLSEAQKVLVEQMGGTLVTIAKDVKIQLEFNPNRVEAYRLIGYENRMLATEDFNDDKKDAGEIGAGHTVTALYEVVPAGGKVDLSEVDQSRYQPQADPEEEKSEFDAELLVVKVRYKEPDGQKSKLLQFPVTDQEKSFAKTDDDFQFAAAVASFGMLLRGSAYQGQSSYDGVLEIAESAKGADRHGYRTELVEMVKRAKPLAQARAALQEEIREAIKAAEAELAKNRPPVDGLQGVVMSVVEDGTIEISLGKNDGLKPGKQLDVYRSEGGNSTRLGVIEIVSTEAAKATCKVLPESSTGEIKASDRVSTRAVEE